MTITLQHIVDIEEALAAAKDRDSFEQAAEQLRTESADLVVMRCDAGDVLEEPFRSYGAFDLHLVDGSAHCPQLTGDPERAGGVLLAWRGAVQ